MGKDFATYFWFRAKVQEKTNFDISCFQIVDQLKFVFLHQVTNRFQLKNHRIISYNIRFVVSHWFIFIIDSNLRMSNTRDIPLLQFLIQCILIHILYESIS